MSMALTLRGMSLRTAVITTLVDKIVRKPVWAMTEDDIREARTPVYPRSKLLNGLLGDIRTDVGIGYERTSYTSCSTSRTATSR